MVWLTCEDEYLLFLWNVRNPPHSVTSPKTQILSSTAVRSLNLDMISPPRNMCDYCVLYHNSGKRHCSPDITDIAVVMCNLSYGREAKVWSVGHHLRSVWLTLLLRCSHHEQAYSRGYARRERFQSGLDGDTHCAVDVELGIDRLSCNGSAPPVALGRLTPRHFEAQHRVFLRAGASALWPCPCVSQV